jgi:hypothetical protein
MRSAFPSRETQPTFQTPSRRPANAILAPSGEKD